MSENSVPEPEAPQPAEPSADDRRSTPRRRKLRQVLITDASQSIPPITGWVIDRSWGGLRLSLDEAVEPGTHLRVRNSTADENVPWVEVTVQSIRPFESTWELGCEYVRNYPWEVLMQFG